VNSALPVALTVHAFNSDGDRPISGKTVTFAVGSGGGTLSATTATTDANGNASVNWTLGSTSGTQSVSATIDGVGGTVFTATALASSPAVVVAESGDQQQAAAGSTLETPLAVIVRDEFGNPVSDATVTFSAAAGTLSAAQAITNEDGVAEVSYTLPTTKGQQIVTAEVNGVKYQFTVVAN
jgi:adhesin/invasin